jgi:predicted phosphodiesterase
MINDRRRLIAECVTDELLTANFPGRRLKSLKEERSHARRAIAESGGALVQYPRGAGGRIESTPGANLEAAIKQEQERQHNREMLRQLTQLQRTEAKRQEYISTIRECLQPFEPTALLPLADDFVSRDERTHKPVHRWVLDLSDWHLGQRTPIQSTGGIYEQTTEIVRWQVQQLISAARSIFDVEVKGQTIEEILVILNGDLHENDSMRPGQAAKIDRLVTQQVVEVFDLVSYVLRALLNFPGVKRIEVHNVGGNHDRTSPKRGDSGLGELDYVDTYAWLIGELLVRAFEGEPRLTVKNWSTYFGYTEFAGRKIIFEHGSSFKGGTGSYGGIPWYPIVNAARMLTDMLGGGDLVLFGHVHQPAILPIRQDGWVVINGALPATSSYLQSTYKALRTPTMWLLDLHEEHGVTDFRPLYARPASLERPGALWKKQ